MNTVLVTGGAGFLGSHVADHLLEQGYRVVIADDLSGGHRRNIPAGATFVQMSTGDTNEVERLFEHYQFRFVFHCAAYAAEGLSHHIRHFIYSNNVLGTIPLINASVMHHVECFVFTSSIAVYGSGPTPFHEDMPARPIDPYGVAKLAIELDLKAAHEYFGLPYIIVRPHNIFGERQNLSDPYRNVIGIFMRRIMEGQPCPVYGNGSQQRAFTYVGDVASCIARSVERHAAYNTTFNVGTDAVVSVRDLAGMVHHAMHSQTGVKFLEERREVHTAYCDHQLSRRLLGYADTIPLDEGLRRMATWARTISVPSQLNSPPIEVPVQLPELWRPEANKIS